MDDESSAYDDSGNIYFDPAGRLRDRQDNNFSLPKLPPDRESLRLIMMGVVNRLLRESNSEFPFAKETYKRLRAEGAGDLEARSLMAGVWTNEVNDCVQSGQNSDENRISANLEKLRPYERDSSGKPKK